MPTCKLWGIALLLATLLLALPLGGCAAPPPAHVPPDLVMSREAYLKWRSERLAGAEPRLRSFAETVETPSEPYPQHLRGRTVTFAALWLSIQAPGAAPQDPIAGRPQAVALLGDPLADDRNRYFSLDAVDYQEERTRFDALGTHPEGSRGTPVRVIAYVTGKPEDFIRSPWIARILSIEPLGDAQPEPPETR